MTNASTSSQKTMKNDNKIIRATNNKNKPARKTILAAFAIITSMLIIGTACEPAPDVIPPAEGAVVEMPIIDFEEEEAPPIEEVDLYPYYYDASREDRYAMYAAEHPELVIEDVYWMVNCDLDKAPYEDTQEIADPDDLLLMVNKHFHLPEGYTPPDLVAVGRTMMRPEAADPLQQMIIDAAAEGHNLWSQSGFRSYSVQEGLYTNYSARDGVEAADTYSARPGHSEHQTGLATDLNTITDAFGSTPEGLWTAENCWKYGFIIRYTADNIGITLYKSEPWHLRYVGVDVATIMRNEQIESFEEYWVKYIKYTPPAGNAGGNLPAVG